jgi:hypothetical protein
MRIRSIKILYQILVGLSFLILQACHSIPKTQNLSHDYLHKINNNKQIDEYFSKTEEIYNHLNKRKSEKNSSLGVCVDTEEKECLDHVVITGSHITAADLITNNQVLGVDEGDIIKQFKNLLVILRKGRLYSINIGSIDSKELLKIDEINAFSPDWVNDAYFDEILIDEGIVLVLGYNYDLKSSEIIRFEISEDGYFKYKDNYLIKSSDYYDNENYASRLFNHQYISYIPIQLDTNRSLYDQLPTLAKIPDGFVGNVKSLEWNNIVDIDDIYYPIQSVLYPTLHSYITCPLDKEVLYCNAVGIIGSDSNFSYNNGENVYLWMSAWDSRALFNDDIDITNTLYDYKTEYREVNEKFKNVDALYNPLVYRISLKDLSVEAIQVTGMPVSQFSFHHFEGDLYMYSVVDEDTGNLLKMPDYLFNKQASNSSINLRTIENIPGISSNERFIDKQLFLGSFEWEYEDFPLLTMINIKSGKLEKFELGHSSNRIEAFNNNALIIGETSESNLGITIINTNYNKIKQTYLLDRLEGENRSHAFNFNHIDDFLLAGLTTQPKNKAEFEGSDYYWDDNISSDITFIGGNNDNIEYIGELLSENKPSKGCKFSCDDWYGNSRPIFIGERIFALSGDELIEGGLLDGEIIEVTRINYIDN